MTKFLNAPARGKGLTKPKAAGPRPLWQPPTINARNGNTINGFFYAIVNGKRKSLRTSNEAEAWTNLRAMQINDPDTATSNPTIGALVNLRLEQAKKDRPLSTYKKIAEALFDLVTGYTCRFGKDHELIKGTKQHDGYGPMTVSDFKAYHAQQWLDAHKNWNQSTRSNRLALLRSVFNMATTLGLIKTSPIAGYKVAPIAKRFSYFDAEIEQAIYAEASPAFAEFLFVCIQTGMRPFSETAMLTADNVELNDKGQMRFNFAKEHKTGAKTGLDRIVYPPPAVVEIVFARMKDRPRGSGLPLFVNEHGERWLSRNANNQFTRIKDAIKLDDRLKKKFGNKVTPACIYSCRHTFATRMIPKVGVPKTAKLMGNTIRVCERNYGHLDCLHEELYEAATK